MSKNSNQSYLQMIAICLCWKAMHIKQHSSKRLIVAASNNTSWNIKQSTSFSITVWQTKLEKMNPKKVIYLDGRKGRALILIGIKSITLIRKKEETVWAFSSFNCKMILFIVGLSSIAWYILQIIKLLIDEMIYKSNTFDFKIPLF